MTSSFRSAAAVLVLAPLALAQPTEPAERPPAPEVKAAVETLRDVFDLDYLRASDAAGKKALAGKLLGVAAERKTPPMIFACYDEARRLAAEAGDASMALAALGALKRRFIGIGDLLRDTLRPLADVELTATDAALVLDLAREEAGAALRRGDFARSAEFAGFAVAAAKRLEDPDLVLELGRLRANAEALQTAGETLRTNPKDRDANDILGAYWVFDRGDWDAGLKHLAAGSDRPLAELAALDLAAPKTAPDRTALGERWYALAARTADGASKRAFAERAWAWYTAAVAVATGDQDLKPSERAKQIEKDYPNLFGAVFEGHTAAVAAVALTPDGKTLVSVGNDALVRVWDPATGMLRQSLAGHEGWIGSVVVTPDGSRAVTAGGDGVVRVWDLKAGKLLGALKGHTGAVRGLALTSDGKLLASGGGDKTVRLWDLATGKVVRTFSPVSSVESVAVTADGSRVLTGTDAGVVAVYDAATGEVVSKFEGHGGTMVYTVAVTRDGKTALSAGRDKVIRVWDVATGKELRTLAGHSEQVYQVVLGPGEKYVLSASFDKTVRLWDFASGKESKRFEGHTDGVQGVCFGPDARTVFSAGWDKTVRRWRVPPELSGRKPE